MKKSHLLLNANILGLNTAILCVVEYNDSNFNPINVYEISRYDELEDNLSTSFNLFPNLKEQSHLSTDSFDKFLEIENWMEELNYQHNKATRIEICGYEISKYLKDKHSSNIDSLDINHDELLVFIKECFHKEYVLEDSYRKIAHQSPFAKIALDDLLQKRSETNKELL
jgi:hypothetical protein